MCKRTNDSMKALSYHLSPNWGMTSLFSTNRSLQCQKALTGTQGWKLLSCPSFCSFQSSRGTGENILHSLQNSTDSRETVGRGALHKINSNNRMYCGPHFFFPLVSSTNTFWSKEVAGLPAEGLAGSHGPLTSVSWGEACNHDALPGYRATMTPHMPSFCTIRGLSLAETEICRSICKTRIVTETSRMPKMVFISMHLQHSAEACNREPQCPCSLCIATITHSTKPTLEVLPWPWEENVGWIPDMISILAFCSIWGRTLQRSSGISPAVLLLLPRSAWRGRWRWTVMQISRHQARPKAVWLPGHRDGCVGRSAFVPAAKDPLREGRQQGRWKLVIQDTSIFLDSLLFYSS